MIGAGTAAPRRVGVRDRIDAHGLAVALVDNVDDLVAGDADLLMPAVTLPGGVTSIGTPTGVVREDPGDQSIAQCTGRSRWASVLRNDFPQKHHESAPVNGGSLGAT